MRENARVGDSEIEELMCLAQVLGSLQSKPELRVMLMEALNGKLPRTGSYNNLLNKHR